MNVVPIVEGDGEVKALPLLLWRIHNWRHAGTQMKVVEPIRVRRDRFLQNGLEFKGKLALAEKKCRGAGWILVLLDADDDCPMTKAAHILHDAQAVVPRTRISVVLANHEYEAWFIAAAASLDGKNGFVLPQGPMPAAESLRGAKEWVRKQLPRGRKYSEVVDQAVFSKEMDLQQAHDGSRSFRKLVSDWEKQITFAGP